MNIVSNPPSISLTNLSNVIVFSNIVLFGLSIFEVIIVCSQQYTERNSGGDPFIIYLLFLSPWLSCNNPYIVVRILLFHRVEPYVR